jgi:hypothetical protein
VTEPTTGVDIVARSIAQTDAFLDQVIREIKAVKASYGPDMDAVDRDGLNRALAAAAKAKLGNATLGTVLVAKLPAGFPFAEPVPLRPESADDFSPPIGRRAV